MIAVREVLAALEIPDRRAMQMRIGHILRGEGWMRLREQVDGVRRYRYRWVN